MTPIIPFVPPIAPMIALQEALKTAELGREMQQKAASPENKADDSDEKLTKGK